MDLSLRPLRPSRAFRKFPKIYDTSQPRPNARGQHENTAAESEANAPVNYQHLRDFRRAKLAERRYIARREPNWLADPRGAPGRTFCSKI